MTVCLFLGPTLGHVEARALLPDADILAPVEHGAVYAAVKARGAKVLGIVDGYFLHRPSVWHKEILWALEQGVIVYGAGSMGALRAAELEAFGMIGVGRVFRRFAEGALPPFAGHCDDDEVAVVHGPPETGYLAVSDAMVDMRATFEAAVSSGVLGQAATDALCDIAKGLHFSDRAYAAVLELARARAADVDIEALARLEAWLPTGRVRQKRADAVELLERIARRSQASAHETSDGPRDRHAFRFEVTEIWHDALPDMLAVHLPARRDEDVRTSVLDELRLTPDAYAGAKRAAMARLALLSTDFSPERYGEADTVERRARTRRSADALRRRHALLGRAAIDDWLEANDLSERELNEMVRRDAEYEHRVRVPDTPEIASAILDHLRLVGDYPSLAARAREKRRALESVTTTTPPDEELVRWYFERVRGELAPGDIEAFARGLGLANTAMLVRLLAGEYHFLSL